MGWKHQPDGFTGTVTVAMLVQYAYGLRTLNQISGAPDWMKTEWLEVEARMSAEDGAEMQKLSSAESNARRHLMMQALLAGRFKLKTHPETNQTPVYELVVAEGGSKLQDAATDSSEHLEMGKDGKPLVGMLRFLIDTTIAQGYSMASLADFLSQPVARVGRPVLDKTGLTSTYDFTINWSAYSAKVETSPNSREGNTPSIFEALQEFGLKLQLATGPIDTIVIDHIERPTED